MSIMEAKDAKYLKDLDWIGCCTLAAEEDEQIFTENYTKVRTTTPKNYNAHHSYCVSNAETGKIIETIHFQEGPIRECGVNGVANEDLILMIMDRLHSFQNSEYACEENKIAYEHLREARLALLERTKKREMRGILGTSEV